MSENRRNRRFWVRRWVLRRNRSGAIASLLKELALEDQGCRNHLGMSGGKFHGLLLKVQVRIKKKQDTAMRRAISPRLKLRVTLRYLAAGDSTLASVYQVPKNTTSNFSMEICTAIYDALRDIIKRKKSISIIFY